MDYVHIHTAHVITADEAENEGRAQLCTARALLLGNMLGWDENDYMGGGA
jgi:hypothetical protein